MNRSLLSSHTSGTRHASAYSLMLRISLLLVACVAVPGAAFAQQAAAPQATPAPPQWPKSPKAEFAPMVSPQQIAVRDRATARWQMLMAGDFAKAYAFTTPTYKGTTSEAAFLVQFEKKPQWHGAEVLAVTCATPTSCVARVRIDLKISLPRTKMDRITTHDDEAWVFEDGQWWHSDNTRK